MSQLSWHMQLFYKKLIDNLKKNLRKIIKKVNLHCLNFKRVKIWHAIENMVIL
jgi:hypothetical protein